MVFEKAVHNEVSVTSTLIVLRSIIPDMDLVFTVLEAPKLILFLKNWYTSPPEAVKITFSPKQAVLLPTIFALGAGMTEIEIGSLISLQERPLKTEVIILRYSVVDEIIAEGERVSCFPPGPKRFVNRPDPFLLCH